MSQPRHLAIIMDGNGRWAQMRGHHRTYGHVRGAQVARQMIEECTRLGIEYLTLYAFSTENWLRPKAEVSILMKILEKYLRRERATLMRENIRFDYIGDISQLPPTTMAEIALTVETTRNNTGLRLVFALNYGGRQEITNAVQTIASMVKSGELQVSEIDQNLVSKHLETMFLPDPDLVIRTSGEFRISNFLLWQSAYSEFFISETLWPDFTIAELHGALSDFSRRDRRFGKASATLHSLQPPPQA